MEEESTANCNQQTLLAASPTLYVVYPGNVFEKNYSPNTITSTALHEC